MKTPPKRLFRERRVLPDMPADRRRVDYLDDAILSPPDHSKELDLSKHVVYMPVHSFIETDTIHHVDALKALGVDVRVSKGASAIDLTRSVLASDAIVQGLESFLFLDADMLFDPADVIRLFKRDEPVVAGVYAAKKLGNGTLNADFSPDVPEVRLGDWADGLVYPVLKVGTGFMRIKVDFLKRMAKELALPWCVMADRCGWPFFLPMIVEEEGVTKYLAEDYAFCKRCHMMGVPPVVDTSFRLHHLGTSVFGWEEAAGEYVKRNRNMLNRNRRPTITMLPEPNLD